MGDQVSKETYIELLKRYAAIKADRDRMGRALEWYAEKSALSGSGNSSKAIGASVEIMNDAGKRAREALGDG